LWKNVFLDDFDVVIRGTPKNPSTMGPFTMYRNVERIPQEIIGFTARHFFFGRMARVRPIPTGAVIYATFFRA
jgi:hypothetical protein